MTDREEPLRCLFGASVREVDGEYVIDIPPRELDHGTVRQGEQYRFAVLEETGESGGDGPSQRQSTAEAPEQPQPPVEIGEMRYVEIADTGDQGDGIARVERGYVIIVPDATEGERVKIEVTDVKSNFAVGRTVDRGP